MTINTPTLRGLAIGMTMVISTSMTFAIVDHIHRLDFTHTWQFDTVYWAALPVWLASVVAFGYRFLTDLDRREKRKRVFAGVVSDLTIKDSALQTVQFRISGVCTDADQIAAADAIYRWITDPAADRRVREAAHRNLHNRLGRDDKPTVSEFLERVEAYEQFLTAHDEVMTR